MRCVVNSVVASFLLVWAMYLDLLFWFYIALLELFYLVYWFAGVSRLVVGCYMMLCFTCCFLLGVVDVFVCGFWGLFNCAIVAWLVPGGLCCVLVVSSSTWVSVGFTGEVWWACLIW